MKKISIITIAYNNKDGLKLTMDSVISQTAYSQIEYIVVDGGSNDGTKELLTSYSSKLHKWVSESDSGIYNAMNKGARMATGEYLLFLNSGDNFADNKVIEKLLAYKPSADIVSGICVDYTEKEYIYHYPPKDVTLYTLIHGSLSHPASIIRRTLFESIGGYIEKYRIISDWAFFVEALLVKRCSYSTVPLLMVYFNCEGISSQSPDLENNEKRLFLEDAFGPALRDYTDAKDESVSNVMYWICGLRGLSKKIAVLPFKVINRIMTLRRRLGKRIGIRIVKRKKNMNPTEGVEVI